MNTCTPPEEFYVCPINGYRGCCAQNPCGEPEPVCPCFTTLTVVPGVSGSVIGDNATSNADGLSSLPPTTALVGTSVPTDMPPLPVSETTSATLTPDSTGPTAPSISVESMGLLSPTSPGVESGPSNSSQSFQSTTTTLVVKSTITMSITSTILRAPDSHDASSSPSTATNGAIAGGVVGGLAVAGLSSLFLWFCCRRKRKYRFPVKEARQARDSMTDVMVQTQYEMRPSDQGAGIGRAITRP
ncbi:hypothetical protein MMC13_002944 [Lambiella insularis]|nr:hypothetical protein [Lambiella insularis]